MPFLFNVRFSSDSKLVEPLRELADRVALYVGYGAPDARQISAAVGESTAAAFAQLPANAEEIEIRFHTSDATFDVTIVVGGALTNPPGAFTCVREGAQTVCRLTRKLPEAFSD
jgi:hypothetical protein